MGVTITKIRAKMLEMKTPIKGSKTNKSSAITPPTRDIANRTIAIIANGFSTLRSLIINCIVESFHCHVNEPVELLVFYIIFNLNTLTGLFSFNNQKRLRFGRF